MCCLRATGLTWRPGKSSVFIDLRKDNGRHSVDILSIKAYGGRNIYSHRPVIRAEVDIGGFVGHPDMQDRQFQ